MWPSLSNCRAFFSFVVNCYCPKFTTTRIGTISTLPNSHTNIQTLLRGNSSLYQKKTEIYMPLSMNASSKPVDLMVLSLLLCKCVRTFYGHDGNTCAADTQSSLSLSPLSSLPSDTSAYYVYLIIHSSFASSFFFAFLFVF